MKTAKLFHVVLVGEEIQNSSRVQQGVAELGLNYYSFSKLSDLRLADPVDYRVLIITVAAASNLSEKECRILDDLARSANAHAIVLSPSNELVDLSAMHPVSNADYFQGEKAVDMLIQRLRLLMQQNARVDRLQETKERLEKAQHLANMGYWTLFVDSCRMHFSDSALQLLSPYLTDEEQVFSHYIDLIHSADREKLKLAVEECVIEGKAFSIDHRMVFQDGRTRYYHSSGRLFAQQNPESDIVLATIQDITDRKLVEITNEHLALYDSLTDLCNRRLFAQRLKRALQNVHKSQKLLAVCFIDLDKFKSINDNLGHAVGDELLKSVAKRLKEGLRHDDIIARLSGDEFAVVIEGIHNVTELDAIIGKLRQSLAQAHQIRNHRVSITASIGITIFPLDSSGHNELLNNADAAMYKAKQLGGNNFCYYTYDMQDKARRRDELLESLGAALENGEMRVFYQPQYESRTQRVIGVEALLRWQHPKLGLLPPSKFLGLAEESGLIIGIGKWALRKACCQIREWRDLGFDNLRLAFNVSAKQLAHGGLPDYLRQVTQQNQITPEMLCVEMTENTLMSNQAACREAVKPLKEVGVKLNIDDFGIGESSMEYLQQLPIDALNIDRSFVMNIADREQDGTTAKAIIAMAHSMGLKAIAEGVETPTHVSFLRKHRCDELQGHLFSPAVPADNLTALLQRQHKFSV